MAFRDLREFIAALEEAGQLMRVRVPVDPILEVAEITDRISKRGGPALLFEQVKGSTVPLLINAFGSPERMCLALGVKMVEEVATELEGLLETKAPQGLLDKLKLLPKLKDLASFFPKMVKDGPCKEVVRTADASLDFLPVIQCWPQDAGRYITFPLVITKDPETGIRNVGTYRMQVFDGKTTAMHWHAHKGGATHYRKAKARGQRIEVAAVLGADPITTFSGSVPSPEGIDEL
ncbi:MAG: UbiD family decarboxylase, partial [candidate division NC10 bacterium]|nr:UbiD family decarboxylase [candidate division NC10 bacterium]